jgi:hypothetical protein
VWLTQRSWLLVLYIVNINTDGLTTVHERRVYDADDTTQDAEMDEGSLAFSVTKCPSRARVVSS